MQWTTIVGVLLIIVGVFGFVAGGFSYNETDTVLDVGPLEVEATHEETIPMRPIASGVALLAGIGLAVAGKVKS